MYQACMNTLQITPVLIFDTCIHQIPLAIGLSKVFVLIYTAKITISFYNRCLIGCCFPIITDNKLYNRNCYPNTIDD